MSIKDFKAKLAETPRYEFQIGSVISWVMGGRYIYAAVKTETGWYATSYNDNGWIPRRMNDDQLLDVLSRPEATKIRLALTWEYLLGPEAEDRKKKSPEDVIYILFDTYNQVYVGWFDSLKKAKKAAKKSDGVEKSEWEKSEDEEYWIATTADSVELNIIAIRKG